MIPKIIHYCWFGRGEKTPLMIKCIKSWKKFCPDFKIIEWNEDNFDINSTLWTKQAYETNKYAFVADYVRIYALKKYGGIYMDTDQELIKPITPFLAHNMFLGFMDCQISAGIIGACASTQILSEIFDYYQDREFIIQDKQDLTPNTEWMTEIFVSHGLKIEDKQQEIGGGVVVYPRTYFCPTSCVSIKKDYSSDTVSIHHWAMSWRSEKAKKSFAKARRHERWIRLRYLPNKIIRSICGDVVIDKLKAHLVPHKNDKS